MASASASPALRTFSASSSLLRTVLWSWKAISFSARAFSVSAS